MNSLHEIFEFNLLKWADFSLTVGTVVLILAIGIATQLFVMISRAVLSRYLSRRGVDKGHQFSIIKLIQYFLWVIAIIIMIQSAGFKITLLLASSAALLVGLGLGLQQIFQDLVSGIFILIEGTIKVDDVIEINGLVGRILAINIRTSKVLTRDGIVIIVPNHKFINDSIINWSHSASPTRFKVNVGVAYGSDVEKVSSILLECALGHVDVIKTDQPERKAFVRFVDFGDNALLFELFFWSSNVFPIENTKSDIRFAIDKRFREEGVVIPFPQRDLHIRTDQTK
ncbi:MAG: mechanosensitive ion channel [Cyclobacteriaceae bacterium]|nr:mechanosensitive ion channel [Cyclobacteriaceae bacterium]